MPCDNKAFLKGIQVAVCFVGLIYKVLTSWEAERVGLLLQKRSKEWRWASFAQAVSTSSIFMDITFGAFTLISLAFFIGHIVGDQKSTGEVLLLVTGFILMVIVGGILVISVDDIPQQLLDNAIVLAVLALLAAILFLADAGTKCERKKRPVQKRETSRKREITVVPKQEQPPQAEQARVEEVVDSTQSTLPASSSTTASADTAKKPKENGAIRSVEIRIKDPTKNWPVYPDHPPKSISTRDIDVLAEAEAVDRMLSESTSGGVALGRTRGNLPNIRSTPVRHTSSFYINPSNGNGFAWRRLNENVS